MPTVPERIAEHVKGQIRTDIEAGILPISLIRTFAELHDHVDANVYLIRATEALGLALDLASQADLDVLNEATAGVDRWLGSPRRQLAEPAPH